jgi:hypothetical protein
MDSQLDKRTASEMEGEPPGEPGIQLGKSHATWFSKNFQKSSSGTGTSQRARTLLKGAQRRMRKRLTSSLPSPPALLAP